MFKNINLLVVTLFFYASLFLGMCFLRPTVLHAAPAADASTATDKCESETLNQENCGIVKIIVQFIQVLSALVGVVVVVMIAYGGVQYALARDNPQAVSAAKQKIINAILALVFYLMIFGFLQWVVPGGVL